MLPRRFRPHDAFCALFADAPTRQPSPWPASPLARLPSCLPLSLSPLKLQASSPALVSPPVSVRTSRGRPLSLGGATKACPSTPVNPRHARRARHLAWDHTSGLVAAVITWENLTMFIRSLLPFLSWFRIVHVYNPRLASAKKNDGI